MKISNHKLAGAPFVEAHAYGGPMQPSLIVLHDTAGRLDPLSSVKWFASKECPNSAHFVVERDGLITQQVMCNRKAWHAGASSFKGRDYCNSYAIGIEIVNPGKLMKQGNQAKAWFSQSWPLADVTRKKTAEHGDGYWMDYTPEQLEAVIDLCRALASAYPITDITTHWEISPGRKVDTNPLFPLDETRRAVFEAAETKPEVATAPVESEAGEGGGITSSRTFSQINELADQGSRVAGWIRSIKRWFWGGTTVATAGTSALMNTNTGTKHALSDLIAAHPYLFVALVASILSVVIYVGIKVVERYIISAWKDGRYRPRGP